MKLPHSDEVVSTAILASEPPEVESNSSTSPSPQHNALTDAIEAWRVRLASAGVACRGVALFSADPQMQVDFPEAWADHRAEWHALRGRIDTANPLGLAQVRPGTSGDLLIASTIQLPQGHAGTVGIALVQPHNDRTVQLVLLSLGWLQLNLSSAILIRSQRALNLLELIGYVGSQNQARSAAQEWINRTAAWARREAPLAGASFMLTLLEVRHGAPKWWVAADTAWAEQASPAMQEAIEVAAQAMAELQELKLPKGWAMPVLHEGEVVAVLVAKYDTSTDNSEMTAVREILSASLSLAEPLLRRWREAERPLWRHCLDAVLSGWHKLSQPGHYAWKAGAGAAALAAVFLLLVPVSDRVAANTVIEGQLRQVVTVPFDGFIKQVLVRPGERVKQGQALAHLDDRDLKLEQARFRSERDQASGKLRQAMVDHDAPAMALVISEVRQAEAQLGLVEAKLSRTALIAPLDGLLVTGDWVQQLGSPIETGKEMFEIAAGQGYRVVLHVPERDIVRVQVGQTGKLRLTGQPHIAYAFKVAKVTAIATVQDTVNGFRVEAEWLGEIPPLSPGMQGVGKIEVGTANLLTIWTRSSINWLRLKLWALMW